MYWYNFDCILVILMRSVNSHCLRLAFTIVATLAITPFNDNMDEFTPVFASLVCCYCCCCVCVWLFLTIKDNCVRFLVFFCRVCICTVFLKGSIDSYNRIVLVKQWCQLCLSSHWTSLSASVTGDTVLLDNTRISTLETPMAVNPGSSISNDIFKISVVFHYIFPSRHFDSIWQHLIHIYENCF